VDPIDRWRRGLTISRAVLGMTVAHIGLSVAVFALTTVQSFTIERDVSLAPGGTATVGDYEFRFGGVKPAEGPNYEAVAGTLTVTRHGAPVAVMTPQKRHYWVQRQVISETAIRMHRGNNLLLALGEDLGAGRWSVRIQIRPLVSLVWIAAFIMAMGGALAASDRRYRPVRARATAPEGATAGQPG
jgi:cytochrome c-type biogenesis protein CcmF